MRYLYLDEEGIHSLYAQTVERFEVERSVNVENAIAGQVAGTVRLKNLFMKVLGVDADASGEVSGTRKSSEQIKQVQKIEKVFERLV
ncbi:MAG: hypothetical protein ACK58M_15750, partial [Acidobacteriota bacterium]